MIKLPKRYKLIVDPHALKSHLEGGDLAATDCTNLGDGLIRVTAPVALAFYIKDGDVRSRAITMKSERVHETALGNAKRRVLQSGNTAVYFAEARREHVRMMLNEWPDTGVAFIYKDNDDSLVHRHPSGWDHPVVRYSLVEGYFDFKESAS